jgi:tetratricopeptide (TPR) repeat protein
MRFTSLHSFYALALLVILAVFPAPVFAQNKPDALVAYHRGHYERAVAICKDELAADKSNMDAHVVLGWSLIKLGRFAEAQKDAERALAISDDPRIVEILGEIHFFEGKNREALRYFQLYIAHAPNGDRIDQVYYFMGEIYIRLRRFGHADIALSTALHYLPGNAVWWMRLAYAKENANDRTGAVSAYERALSLNPQLSDARRGLERLRASLAGNG